MKLTVRRIGNSLGVIVPKARLAAWGIAEGGELELTEQGIRPVSRQAGHEALDLLKFSIALEVVRRFSAAQIRAQILANLHRWKSGGSWVSAYDEWQSIASSRSDGALFSAMLSRDERSRKAAPVYAFRGLASREVVRA